MLRYVQSSDSDETAVAAIADTLDFILKPITNDNQRVGLYHDIAGYLSQAEPQTVGLQREDLVGAATTILLSIVAVLPSLLPLLLLPDNTALAIRISNFLSFLWSLPQGIVGAFIPTQIPGKQVCFWPLFA